MRKLFYSRDIENFESEMGKNGRDGTCLSWSSVAEPKLFIFGSSSTFLPYFGSNSDPQNNFGSTGSGSTTLELRNATQKNMPNDGQLRYLHTIPVCGGGGGLESADLVPVADILSCCGGQPAPTGLELPAGHVLDILQGPGLTGHGAAPAHTAVHHVQRLPKY